MTTDQIRFNAEKPKLSYIFASSRALAILEELGRDELHHLAGLPFLTFALVETSRYLDGHDKLTLARVAVRTLIELERDLNPLFADDLIDVDDSTRALGLFPTALAAVCRVYEYGSRKYERGNYRKGAPVTSYLDSALRHLLAWAVGEKLDPESQQSHLAHVFWNLWIALDQPASRDDRLPPPASYN